MRGDDCLRIDNQHLVLPRVEVVIVETEVSKLDQQWILKRCRRIARSKSVKIEPKGSKCISCSFNLSCIADMCDMRRVLVFDAIHRKISHAPTLTLRPGVRAYLH